MDGPFHGGWQALPPRCNSRQGGLSCRYWPFGCFDESVVLGVALEELDEVSLDGVVLDGVELDEDDGVLDDGLALDPLVDEDESLLLELGGVALLELELLGLLELGGVALLELELLGLEGLGLALIEPELEPLLEDGLDLLPIEELELDDGDVASREAPVLEPGPLLQP